MSLSWSYNVSCFHCSCRRGTLGKRKQENREMGFLGRSTGPLLLHCAWTLKTQSFPRLLFCLFFSAFHTREPGERKYCKKRGCLVMGLGGFLNSYRSRKNSSRNSPLPALATPQTHQSPDWDLTKRASNVESFRKAFLMKDHDLCPFHKVCSFAWKKKVSLIHMQSLGPISHLTETFICGHPLLLRMSNCWEILKTEFSHLQGVWVLCVRKQRLSDHRKSRSRVCREGRCAQWWVAGRRKRKRERYVKNWKWG